MDQPYPSGVGPWVCTELPKSRAYSYSLSKSQGKKRHMLIVKIQVSLEISNEENESNLWSFP